LRTIGFSGLEKLEIFLNKMLKELEDRIKKEENKEKAILLQRFFKTGKGEYGEGDIFLGIVVPIERNIAKKFKYLAIDEILELLDSKIHEKRMIGLFILIDQYKLAKKNNDNNFQEKIFNFYLDNANKNNINNWDLVDLSSPNIVGDYLIDKDRKILYTLSKSNNLWERRIAVLATFAFIKLNEFKDTIKISEILLNDKHDLIQKAVGWMLREVGKRDVKVLEEFLKLHYKKMPRTMLRYAIEKFNEENRKKYLKGEI
jgi:3-methyladenine DNA glycosylase AlkD